MSEGFQLTIMTPEKILFKGGVLKLNLKNYRGRFQILHNHISMITLVEPHITELETEEGELKKIFTSKGIVKVKKNNVMFLCESGELEEDIDFDRAKEAKSRAEERLKGINRDNIDTKRAEYALLRALTRLSLRS